MPADAWAVPITVGERSYPGVKGTGVNKGSGTQIPAARTPMAGQGSRIDDTMLIREAQRGNRAAFEELVRHYDQAVLRLALHLTGSEHDAQDIFQDAFLKAYKNVGSEQGLVFNCPNRLYKGHGRKEPVDEIRHEEETGSCFHLD